MSKQGSKQPFKSVPKDLIVDILSKVGASSVNDLRNVSECCKEFNHASNGKLVFKRLSIDHINLIPINT